MANENEALLSRLDAIEKKLDTVIEHQQWSEELIDEMKPIAGLMMKSAISRLEGWRERGVFDMLKVAGTALDRVLDNYTKDDAELLADALVGILGTVRSITQPGVLQLADEATDLLLDPGDAKPVSIFGVMTRAARDQEVQRGLGVMLELLRAVGRTRRGDGGEPVSRRAKTSPAKTAPKKRVEKPAAAAVRPSEAGAPTPSATPEPPAGKDDEIVQWEGHQFYSSGFLVDPSSWTPELSEKIAAGLGIELTEEHRFVIQWVRDDYATTGASPNVRRVAAGSGVGTQAMYRLFPPTPGKTCALIAGVPKPVGCV